jgi:enolase
MTSLAPRYAAIDGAAEWTGTQLADHVAMLVAAKPSVGYVQDALREDDATEMRRLMARVGRNCVVAGDAVFASAHAVIERVASDCVANTMVLRVNDAGTVTGAMNAARCFTAIVPGGSIAVAPEPCDPEAAFAADLAFAIGARFLHVGGGIMAGSGVGGAAVLSRLQRIATELAAAGDLAPPVASAPLYPRIALPPEPAEPLGMLDAPTKEVKRRR